MYNCAKVKFYAVRSASWPLLNKMGKGAYNCDIYSLLHIFFFVEKNLRYSLVSQLHCIITNI